jgi:hypothetical protein
MPRGGRRVGAGRKRKTPRQHFLSGDAGKRGLALVPARPSDPVNDIPASEETAGADVVPIRDAPAMLTKDELPYWAWYSAQAYAKGTLTEHTMPGFVLLCQVAARRARLWAQIDRDGDQYEAIVVDGAGNERVSKKPHPLLTHARGLDMRLEQLQARFGIMSAGKIADEKKPKPDDEREQLRRLLAVR